MRWLERLPPSSAARCRTLFSTHTEFSDITPTQYEAAYTWLHNAGLLDDLDSSVSPRRRVFIAAVTHAGTAWFPDADVLIRGADEVPEDALRAAEVLGLDDADAYAQIAAAWGKVDTEMRECVGAAGELELVELLAEFCNARVEHIAAVSDGYGYDIAVHARERTVCIEAKATTRHGRIVFYLSRNEYETMCRNPAWQLVIVRLAPDLKLVAVATVPRGWIDAEVPRDLGQGGRWESCRLEVPLDVPASGIPELRSVLRADAPTILTGSGVWAG
ncbi:protein NO VEIN domain-containing protein [Pseudonocardia xinjiangensis]|uniref:protein NO VEIN domain-containing protein n=1 Tax=Pseudonocardia xinjiangensis TaxID=75289 RepID=UPI003D8B3C3C